VSAVGGETILRDLFAGVENMDRLAQRRHAQFDGDSAKLLDGTRTADVVERYEGCGLATPLGSYVVQRVLHRVS
jgi:hypothetical protein